MGVMRGSEHTHKEGSIGLQIIQSSSVKVRIPSPMYVPNQD